MDIKCFSAIFQIFCSFANLPIESWCEVSWWRQKLRNGTLDGAQKIKQTRFHFPNQIREWSRDRTPSALSPHKDNLFYRYFINVN